MLEEWGPLSFPAGMYTILPATMRKGQACGHSFSHDTCCVEARYTSLYPKILDNLHNHSLGENKGRHALKSWVSPNPLDQGGDPACERAGSKPPLLKQLAFGEGMVTELELPASSHMLTSLRC